MHVVYFSLWLMSQTVFYLVHKRRGSYEMYIVHYFQIYGNMILKIKYLFHRIPFNWKEIIEVFFKAQSFQHRRSQTVVSLGHSVCCDAKTRKSFWKVLPVETDTACLLVDTSRLFVYWWRCPENYFIQDLVLVTQTKPTFSWFLSRRKVLNAIPYRLVLNFDLFLRVHFNYTSSMVKIL